MHNTDTDGYWREDAMNGALRAAAYTDGDGGDALLRAIRRRHPQMPTLKLGADRPQLLEFLRRHTDGFQSLLAATHTQKNDDGDWPYIGWYGVRWEGTDVEVVLPPGWSGGQVICLGADAAALSGFADRLADFVIRPAGRCLRYTEGWENAPDMDAELGKVVWDDIVLPPDVLAGVRQVVEGFFAQKAAFRALGFPWKRGVLLVGPPGTGKTMICKAAVAALPDLPFLYVRDLNAGREWNALAAIFDRARQLAPCILAFEDVDGLVGPSTRSVFLNELDGFQSNDGLLIIASSNHPGQIDEALLKRPSRFDRVFHIGLPGPEERREYCRRLLSRGTLAAHVTPSLVVDDLARQVSERTDGFTPAYLKEVFVSAALRRVQDDAPVLDGLFGVVVLEQVDELREHLKRMRDPDALGEMQSGAAMSLRR